MKSECQLDIWVQSLTELFLFMGICGYIVFSVTRQIPGTLVDKLLLSDGPG